MASKKRSKAPCRQCADTLQVLTRDGHVRPLIEIEREMVSLALVKNRGNVTKAAAELGIGRTTLYRYRKD